MTHVKPTQVKELFANIRKTFVSFFSILMFVALGVGIFLGISWAGPALQNAADNEFDKGSLHHFQIQYPYGLTDDDLTKLAKVEGVSDIEPTRQSFQTATIHGVDRTVKVQTLTERIDVPDVIEGELPSSPNEIALNEVAAMNVGCNVGDTITFIEDGNAGGDDDPSALLAQPADTAVGESEGAGTVDKDGMKYLNGSTYKVTALVKSPEYVARASATYGLSTSPTGSIDLLAWVPAEAFDASAFQNGYPVVDVVCNSLTGLATFSDNYKKASSELEQGIVDVATDLANARFEDLHGQAGKKIDDAQQQLDEGKQKIADGEQQLADGRVELESRKAEGEAKLAEGYQTLMYYEGLKKEGEAKLAEGRATIAQAEGLLAEADKAKAEISKISSDASDFKKDQDAKLAEKKITQEEYDANLDAYGSDVTDDLKEYADKVGIPVPVIDHTNFNEALEVANEITAHFEEFPVTFQGETMTLAQARVRLAEGRQQLADAEAQYNEAVPKLNAGWAQYYAGWDELNRLVAEGEQKLADGEAELAEAKEKVAENEPKLEKAKQRFASMKQSRCAVMSRSYNTGAAQVSMFSDITSNLSFSMAALFIIVGLLVSYFAVSRIVHEQITQIGTKKALGLRSREITTSFLAYSAIAVVAGAIVGTIMGVLLVEGIIGRVFSGMFAFGGYPPYFGVPLFFVVVLLELVLVLGATYLACRRILKEHAVELLKGEKPPEGKTRFYEKWELWDGLPLFIQTIVNNCMNDRRRVLSTIVGVAGCTALIVTAITLNDNVTKSYDRHYETVYGFNAIAYVDAKTDGAADEVEKALEQEGYTATPVLRQRFILTQPDGNRGAVRVVVPSDESKFANSYHVNPVSGNEFDPSSDGVWVSQAYADHFGAKVGDILTFEDADGRMYEAPISGFHEFWLTYHEAVMGRDAYKNLFGEDAVPNVVLVDVRDADLQDVAQRLESVNGFHSIADDKTSQHSAFETFSKVSGAVVLIYIALSTLMAIVVLLNLNVMFIEEKKRELIVLMINGFSVKDARHYISYDNIVLTAIGIIVGMLLGCIMGSITVATVEPSTSVFLKSPDGLAIGVGIVGSAILAIIMSLIALRRVSNFKLTDINRF